MMMFSAADLPLNARGAVYHLDLLPDELADIIITVGDRGRVPQISQHFDSIEVQRTHREFVTHTGYLQGKRITVMSTGIGVPNIDIVMNELDALANIDLSSRSLKACNKKFRIIRLGTTGALQKESEPGDIIVSRFGVGFDNLLEYYQTKESPLLVELKTNLKQHLDGAGAAFYVAEADPSLLQHFSKVGLVGITVTCSGFYGPQGRRLRKPLAYPDLLEKLSSFEFLSQKILNFEMETAAILGLGQLFEHSCLSLSVVLANRKTGSFALDVHLNVEKLIHQALGYILTL